MIQKFNILYFDIDILSTSRRAYNRHCRNVFVKFVLDIFRHQHVFNLNVSNNPNNESILNNMAQSENLKS